MRFPLIFVSVVAMFAAIQLDPWGKSKVAAVLYLVGAAGFIWGVMAT